jgi:hypothetical protein
MGRVVQTKLELQGVTVINPFDVEEQRAFLDDTGDMFEWTNDEYSAPDVSNWIVKKDLAGVDDSTIVICVYPDGPTIGIPCEMFYGWMKGKVVYSVVPERYIHHPWVAECSNIVFTDLDECVNSVIRLMNACQEDVGVV